LKSESFDRETMACLSVVIASAGEFGGSMDQTRHVRARHIGRLERFILYSRGHPPKTCL
jgi:hypothetical protein